MKLDVSEIMGRRVQVTFNDGIVLTGKIDDYTTSTDNDDQGEVFGIRPEIGRLKNRAIEFSPMDVLNLEVLTDDEK